jgi:dinuclear metal center YbgI/SA1388 family protein
MISLIQLQKYLEEYMNYDRNIDVAKIDPYMTNGLMVRGRDKIKKIGFGVSASLKFFKLAKEEECDGLIVHHSFNFPDRNRFDSIFQNRFNYLLNNEISLFGYHFLLDAHPEIGHNAQILQTIGAKKDKQFNHHGDPWGWIGEYEKPMKFASIIDNLKPYLSEKMTLYEFGPKEITKVVTVSGKGAPAPSVMQDLIDQRIDLYITGEVHEWNRELFREAGINFIAGGHYATEVFGLKALMDKINGKFPSIETKWLKLHNPV